MWRSAESFCAFGLGDARLGLCQAGLRGLPRRFLAVVFRLGDQGVFVQTLGAGPIELGAFEVGLRAVQVGHGCIQRGVGGDSIGPGGFQPRLRGVHVGRGLHVFQLRQQLAFLDPVAFLHIKPGNLAEGIGADVDVSLRLDLAGGADNRSQIHRLRFAGLDRDHAFAALMNGNAGNRQYDDGDAAADQYFLSQCSLLPGRTLLDIPVLADSTSEAALAPCTRFLRRNWGHAIRYADGAESSCGASSRPSNQAIETGMFQWVYTDGIPRPAQAGR